MLWKSRCPHSPNFFHTFYDQFCFTLDFNVPFWRKPFILIVSASIQILFNFDWEAHTIFVISTRRQQVRINWRLVYNEFILKIKENLTVQNGKCQIISKSSNLAIWNEFSYKRCLESLKLHSSTFQIYNPIHI